MSRSDDQRVADILDACDELEGVVRMRSEGEVLDGVLLRAAERLLEIIGEAASNVSDAGMNQYPRSTGAALRASESCWPTTTTASIPT
jgi:uncharacterized protein with HEPN domain